MNPAAQANRDKPDCRRRAIYQRLALCMLLFSGCGTEAASDPAAPGQQPYDVHFSAQFSAEHPVANAAITLSQTHAVVKSIDLNAPAARYTVTRHDGDVKIQSGRIIWTPPAGGGALAYQYQIDHVRGDAYDAHHTPDWVLMRLDDLFPAAKVRTVKGAKSRSTVDLRGPAGWSFESRYGKLEETPKPLHASERNWVRPTGWLIGGKLGTRRDFINGRRVVVSAPVGSGVRRIDTLAFLHWTLPELTRVLPSLPAHVFIAGAPAVMWRGGLSGPGSIYLHAGRPLISENGTSTLLHELIHMAGLHSGAPGADWIVEGLAEYYGLLILKRSGGLSENRFQQTIAQLQRWAAEADGQLRDPSTGADTAAAVLVLHNLAAELTQAGRHIDELLNQLLKAPPISEQALQAGAATLLGKPSKVLSKALSARRM